MEIAQNERLSLFPASGIRTISNMASQPGYINLSLGEPDLVTPKNIRGAAKRALDRGETHYTVNLGRLEARKAVASRMKRLYDRAVDPDTEIILTVGGAEALFLALATALRPGDEVLIPDPGYIAYASQVLFFGGHPVPYRLRMDNGFLPDPDELEKMVSSRCRFLILNSPANPTGAVIPRETMLQIAAVAERHSLVVISDAVYDELVYDGRKVVDFASLPGMKEQTITVNSLSKTYAMTGWRVGYLIANPTLVQAMMKVHQLVATCVPSMVQYAMIEALEGDQSSVSEMVAEYQARRDLIVDLLNRVPGFRCALPHGAFYTFPDIRGTGMSSWPLAEFLLKEAKVGCVPGLVFGSQGDGHLRISYATSREKLQQAGERIARALRSVA